jgi:hypothetical protein
MSWSGGFEDDTRNVSSTSSRWPAEKKAIKTRQLLADEIELLLVSAEPSRINELYRQGALNDGARRRLEREFDLREANLANHEHNE